MCKVEASNKVTVQKCYVVKKNTVGNILGLEAAKHLNSIKLQNVDITLDECEFGENIQLQNLSKIVFDECYSCANCNESVSKPL